MPLHRLIKPWAGCFDWLWTSWKVYMDLQAVLVSCHQVSHLPIDLWTREVTSITSSSLNTTGKFPTILGMAFNGNALSFETSCSHCKFVSVLFLLIPTKMFSFYVFANHGSVQFVYWIQYVTDQYFNDTHEHDIFLIICTGLYNMNFPTRRVNGREVM